MPKKNIKNIFPYWYIEIAIVLLFSVLLITPFYFNKTANIKTETDLLYTEKEEKIPKVIEISEFEINQDVE